MRAFFLALFLSSHALSSESLVKEAKKLYTEQKMIESEKVFLQAIEETAPHERSVPKEEEALFLSLFELYEQESFIDRLQQSCQDHPDWTLLLYYKASSAANRGRLDLFYEDFYKAYIDHPHCFMADRILGTVYFRLFEGSLEEEDRNMYRKKAILFWKKAFCSHVHDSVLLQKILFLVREDEKKQTVCDLIKTVVSQENPLKRADCLYMIDYAITLKLYDEAKILFDKASSWYGYSRGLDAIRVTLTEGKGASP